MDADDRSKRIADYVAGLEGYTYLEDEGVPAEIGAEGVNGQQATVNEV